MSNLFIFSERCRGFKTVLAATLVKLVVDFKNLNRFGEAPKELRFNKNPYVLIVGFEDVDCLPMYKAFQPFLNGCEISLPSTHCTNVRLRKNLINGCDILLLDRKKVNFLRDGEVSFIFLYICFCDF